MTTSRVPDGSILFSSLPKWRAPWRDFFLSYGTQAIVVAIFVWIPVLHHEIIEQPAKDYHAIELVPTPVPVNLEPQRQLPRHVLVAKLDPVDPPPTAIRLPAAQPKLEPKVEDTPAPEVKIPEKKPEVIASAPAVIPRTIKTNVFSTGSSAPQTIERAPDKVQTGGFGDPNGVPARTATRAAVNIAQSGGFDLPTGPGYGNGSGGANGARGVVASTGFGSGIATANAHAAPATTVHAAGFGDADLAAPPTVQSHAATPTPTRVVPAEILSKPTPLYTAEARAQRIEGEVLLEVVFEASGRLRVTKVVRGLGHGLDDAAIHAAEQIRFKPALKDGQPSDSTAVVHIIFQLA
jgi:TonB family protein